MLQLPIYDILESLDRNKSYEKETKHIHASAAD